MTIESFFLHGYWRPWIGPATLLAGSLLLGWFLEWVLISATKRLLNHTSIELNRELASFLRGVVLFLCLLVGADLATSLLPNVTETGKVITHKILLVLGLVLAVRVLAKVAVATVRFYLTRSHGLKALPNTSIFENVLRLAVYTLGILILMQSMGIPITPLITALGIGGLAVSLSLQDTFANMFAGLNMILARQVKVGDYVKLEGGFEGTVEDIGWRTTVVRHPNNNRIIVPNNKMSTSVITNCTQPLPETTLTVDSSVTYGSDLAEVEQMTLAVAQDILKSTQGAVKDFAPFVRFHTFGESAILFNVTLRVKAVADVVLIKHEFIKQLHARFQQAGISAPYPQRILHVRDGIPGSLKHILPDHNGHGETQPAVGPAAADADANPGSGPAN